MWQQMGLDNKIAYLQMKIEDCQKSIQMYLSHIEQHRGRLDTYAVAYVRGCKQRMKAYKSDLAYYQSELDKLEKERDLRLVFQ